MRGLYCQRSMSTGKSHWETKKEQDLDRVMTTRGFANTKIRISVLSYKAIALYESGSPWIQSSSLKTITRSKKPYDDSSNMRDTKLKYVTIANRLSRESELLL